MNFHGTMMRQKKNTVIFIGNMKLPKQQVKDRELAEL